MSPFEALYDRKCNTPINWNDPLEKVFLGHDMLKEMEQEIVVIRKNFKDSSRQEKQFCKLSKNAQIVMSGETCLPCIKPRKSSLKLGFVKC